MNCEQVRELLPVYVESDPSLTAAERKVVAGHLEACPQCAAEAEVIGEQVALLRGAGEWARKVGREAGRAARPSPRVTPARSRPGAVRNGRRPAKGRGLPVGWVAAAAAALAACLAGWYVLGRGGGETAAATGRLVEGELVRRGRSVGVLLPGNDYTVPDRASATFDFDGGTRVSVAGGSSFRLADDFETRPRMQLLRGKMTCSSDAPFEVSGYRIRARVCGSFALVARESRPAGLSAAPPAARGWTDLIFPAAIAAEPSAAALAGPPEAFLLLSGWAEVRVNGSSFRLAAERALVGGDGSDPGVGEPGRLVADMVSERASLLQGLLSPRYRAMVAEYSARAVRYRERRALPETGAAELADLAWRIALVDEMRAAHSARLAELAAAEDPRLSRADLLGARIDVLCDLREETGRDGGTPASPAAAANETETAAEAAAPGTAGHKEGGMTK
ncbi:MAG: anti-sigma factor family protein [Planctomycetota bacterium]|jgi:hypothetical protein